MISKSLPNIFILPLIFLFFVFGDFIHHKEWLIYFGGTYRPGELCYNFSISNYLTQMVNFPTRTRLWLSRSCSFGFISSDASIRSTLTFPPLGNSDYVFVSVSIDFLINSKQDAPFHHIAYGYSHADWDCHDHL